MSQPSSARLPPRRARPALVGRERERSLLRAQLDAALGGQGGLVLVGGEAGIGKTTLVEDLAAQAEAAGALVLWGHCFDLTVTPPYGPWIGVVRRYQATGREPSFPAFLDEPEALAALGSQERLFAEIAVFFTAAAARRSLVVLLDDLQWADQASLDLLRVLAREVRSQPLLLVATYRSDELTRRHPLAQLIPLLVREAAAERLEVRPLDEGAQGALVAARYRLPSADVMRLERYLHAHAEGNPLFAGELLRTLEDDGVLVARDGAWRLGDLSRLRVPPLLLQVIERRLERLTDDARGFLQVAAVIGQEVPLDLWQRVSRAGDERFVTAIEQGQAAQLLAEAAGGTSFRFRHALIREALYEEVVALRRRVWHRQVGEALAEGGSPDPDAVAYHFAQAGDARAAAWLLQAGERAQRAYSWVTAVERFETAFARLSEQGAPASDRAVLLFRIAYLQRFVDPRRAVALCQDAHRLAAEAGEPGLAARCLSISGLLSWWLGDVGRGLAAMEQAQADYHVLFEAQRERLWSLIDSTDAPFGGELASALAQTGRLAEAVALGERLIAGTPIPPLQVGQGTSSYADCLMGLARARALLGQPEPARRAFEQARAIYRTIDHHQLLATAYGWELEWLQLSYYPDDLEARRRLAEEVEEAARRGSAATVKKLPARYLAVGQLVLEGAWQEARQVAAATDEQPVWLYRLVGLRWRGLLAREQGDGDLARRVVADVLPDGPATEPGNTLLLAALPLQRLAADLALVAGDLPAARAWLEAHARWLAWSGAVLGRAEGALGWAQYHHASGNPLLARRCAEQAFVHALDPRQPLALVAVHRTLARLDTDDRRFPEADSHLRLCLALTDACGTPFERALTLLTLAELRVAERRVEEARALLTEARAICAPLEAGPALARVDALEARLAHVQPRRRHQHPAGLTTREIEVLRLVAAGLPDAEVAERLFLSPRTVGTHLTAIYTKLNVNSRAAATRFAVEQSLA